jgi:hypothetical protein
MVAKIIEERKDGAFDIIVDVDDATGNERVSVYRGETLLAMHYQYGRDTVIAQTLARAKELAPQFR